MLSFSLVDNVKIESYFTVPHAFVPQFSAKRDACDEKSAGARNDYLLTLAASNAHQRRYYEVDFERFLRVSAMNDSGKTVELRSFTREIFWELFQHILLSSKVGIC